MTLLTLLTFVLSVLTLYRMLRGGSKGMGLFALRLRIVFEGFSVMMSTGVLMALSTSKQINSGMN